MTTQSVESWAFRSSCKRKSIIVFVEDAYSSKLRNQGKTPLQALGIPEDFLTSYRMSIAHVGRPDCGKAANVISEQFHGPSNLDLDIEGKANMNVFLASFSITSSPVK